MKIRIFYTSWNKADHVVNPANVVLSSDLKFVLIVTCTTISLVKPWKRYFPDLNLCYSQNSNTSNLPHSDSIFVVISPRHRRKDCQHHLQKIQVNFAEWIFENVNNFEIHKGN